MAKLSLRREENVSGDFYVDTSCIDCDTCRWMAPETFGRKNNKSNVYKQPKTDSQRRKAYHALISCPTQSIGTEAVKRPSEVMNDFPLLISDNVYHLGFHSNLSFGAAAYLIVLEEGNVMVDSPRYSKSLAKRVEALGGVKHLFLTHRDDVADHEKFHQHFNCERWIHQEDAEGELNKLEHVFLDEERFISKECEIIKTPGHTAGSCCLKFKDFLFSGDHLAWSFRLNHLYAFYNYRWDWQQTIDSMERLSNYHFKWVLPGHGRRFYADHEEIKKQMKLCLTWMRQQE